MSERHDLQQESILASSSLTDAEKTVMSAVIRFREDRHLEEEFWNELAMTTGMPSDELLGIVARLVISGRMQFARPQGTSVVVIDPPLVGQIRRPA